MGNILTLLLRFAKKTLPNEFSDLMVSLSDIKGPLKLFYKTIFTEMSRSEVENIVPLKRLVFETKDYLHIYN